MQNNQMSESPGEAPVSPEPARTHEELKGWTLIWERLVRLGFGETVLRIGTSVISVLLFLIVIWVMGNFYVKGPTRLAKQAGLAAAGGPASTPTLALPTIRYQSAPLAMIGITRLSLLHTTLPTRPRFEITQYEVQAGDNLIAIAQRFGLNPKTLLWGNYEVLADDPERLMPGQQLNILPVDGVLHKWAAGEGLRKVAEFFGVTPDAIIDWPGNNLSAETIGDLAAPNIPVGTPIVIPGGKRDFSGWTAPRIVRTDPSTGKSLGVGACGKVVAGAVGSGGFIWPTTEHFISGYTYTPDANHYGIDIGGKLGNPVYAVDNGVVVYAGWSEQGYGNLVIIDHGNGWQSLYAHLNDIYVTCGMSLF
ncbi:MAG: peptidoglycan DD-metalloendopeptidase family protein, partial [Anaerolineaceae bacterium]|nr:peptidoglycan DD-metalloendopeptidase family protein [Anaerolineaceae bacterium]